MSVPLRTLLLRISAGIVEEAPTITATRKMPNDQRRSWCSPEDVVRGFSVRFLHESVTKANPAKGGGNVCRYRCDFEGMSMKRAGSGRVS